MGQLRTGRLHMRMLILVALIAICALASGAYIASRDKIFPMRIEGFEGRVIEASNLSVDPPGLARVVEVREEPDGAYAALIEGLQPGEGFLFVNLADTGGVQQLDVRDDLTVVGDGANFNGWEALPVSVAVCFAAAALICIWNLIELRAHAWYSYAMAVYAGGALFCIVEAAIFGGLVLSGETRSFIEFAVAVTDMADGFVNLLVPPLIVAAALVCASNIALVRKEGMHPANLLGIAASLAFALALLAQHFLGWQIEVSDSYEIVILLFTISSVFSIGVGYLLALFVGVCTCAYGAARHRPSHPRDYLIILGCGLRADGTPTPLLAGRVDAALDYAKEQTAQGLASPVFVPSGGQGSDEPMPEARSMKNYLVEKGMDEALVLPEERSTNTRENFAFSSEVIAENGGGPDARIAFATTNYHVFRSYIFAHEAGLAAEGIAAPTKLYFWPNAFLREFVGLLAARLLPILAGYLVVAAIYLAAEFALILS